MLQKDFRIENLKSFVRAAREIYNFEPLAIGALVYFDKKAGEKTELKGINLAIKYLSVADTSGVIIKNISFTGNLDYSAAISLQRLSARKGGKELLQDPDGSFMSRATYAYS